MDLLKLCVVGLCFLVAADADADSCGADDYHFEYTQCDSQSQRWRVSVPNNDDCTPIGDRAPIKGTACNFHCDTGQYLDMATQGCESCKPGTYSMGNSAKYEDWSKLPEGFTATTQDISYSFSSLDSNCTNHGWTPKGSYIAVSAGSCSSYLRYSGTITQAGQLTFSYQLPDIAVIFHVTVQNDQCQKEDDASSSVWPESTVDGKWKEAQVNLNSGFNVITWKVIGLSYGDQESSMPVLIKSVKIQGAAYTSECTKCPAGTYSGGGASDCTYCPANMHSDKGAGQCTACNTETEWSRPGATKCEKRPSCKETDYYRLHTPCDEKKQTRVIYQWIEPLICQPNNPDSVHLPPNGAPAACQPCNPGMELVNNTCQYCPKDYYSVGEKCEKCEASTFPDTAFVFDKWNSIPKELEEKCYSFSDTGNCHNDTKWLAMGDHIETHFARGESAYVILQISVEGFRTEGSKSDEEHVTVGQFKMVFETVCEGFCQMVLLSTERGDAEVVMSWERSQSKQNYIHDIKKNKSMEFTIAFQNSAYMLANDGYVNATGFIYSIEVTNTIGGGAKECQKCPKGTDKKGCIPCPDGHFIDPVNITCVSCPPGTVVYTNNAYGAESCKPCGKGLKPQGGKVCMTDGLFTDGQGRDYDLRNLTKGVNVIKGSPLFTSSGTQYFHSYNISLFGTPVVCSNNVTKSNVSAVHSQNKVEAMICRSTMVPTSGDSSVVMATQSSSLGDRLVEIISNETYYDNGTETFIAKLYNASGFDSKDIESDIQFHYNSFTPTRACPNGRQTIISLRCDIDEKGNGVIDFPPKCADGTCDGCTFHFLWRSRVVCPTCKKEDYHVVNGECIKGTQTVHYFPPAYCIVRDKALKLEEEKRCTLKLISALPVPLQLAIPAVIAIAALLCCLLCYSWRKNKKLEYKYMKLVEGAEGKEGELPGVDSCALEEGEDDGGDSVLIKDSKGAKFFKKLKNKMSKDDDAFESTLMNERMPLT